MVHSGLSVSAPVDYTRSYGLKCLLLKYVSEIIRIIPNNNDLTLYDTPSKIDLILNPLAL